MNTARFRAIGMDLGMISGQHARLNIKQRSAANLGLPLHEFNPYAAVPNWHA
jgi:hypothetical protein